MMLRNRFVDLNLSTLMQILWICSIRPATGSQPVAAERYRSTAACFAGSIALPGQPIDPITLGLMEERFGKSLSHVRSILMQKKLSRRVYWTRGLIPGAPYIDL